MHIQVTHLHVFISQLGTCHAILITCHAILIGLISIFYLSGFPDFVQSSAS